MFCLCSGFNLKTEVSRNAGLDRLLGNVLQIYNCMTNNLLYLVIWRSKQLGVVRGGMRTKPPLGPVKYMDFRGFSGIQTGAKAFPGK